LQHRDLESRVIGGTIANSVRFPYYTFIKSYSQYGGGGSCGGSLIASDVVLTAAHCLATDDFYGTSILGIDVFVNSTTYKYSEYEYYREATKWVVHPDYNPSNLANDIALIFLDAPVKSVPLVVMNRNASIPVSKNPSALRVIGLGVENINNSYFDSTYTFPDQLMQAELNPLSVTACKKRYGSYSIGEKVLCAGGDGLASPCYGDSGGPLLMMKSSAEKDVQVGIVSWGTGCDPDSPGVFTRVSSFGQWIDVQICKYSKSKPSTCPTLRPTKKPSTKPVSG
jgi:secreted trypsin-like serine protease